MPSEAIPTQRIPRPLHVALFAIAMVWFFASETVATNAAHGFAVRFALADYEFLLSSAMLLFLLVTGFAALHWIATQQVSVRQTLALPLRPGWPREWAVGAAIGWGLVLGIVLPMALMLALRPHAWWQARTIWLALVGLASLAAGTLAQEVVFRGYPFRRLMDGIGPAWATLVMAIVFSLWSPVSLQSPLLSLWITMLFSVLLSIAYLRTHALWLPWGLHFAWSASTSVLFGLPLHGDTQFSVVIETRSVGPLWLTGGAFGPSASLLAVPLLLVGMAVLYRVTRDYAWSYTHEPIVAAGYPMDVAPPPAHEAMELEAAKPGALVQILPVTPQGNGVKLPGSD